MRKVQPVFIRTPFNYDMEAASDEAGLCCEDASLTQQQFAEEADINTLVKRFHLTGQMPDRVVMPSYGDFSGVSDFQSAMDMTLAARDGFMQYPAEVRARFDHDPGRFLEFFEREENRAEAERMGLVLAKPPAVAVPAPGGTSPTGGGASEPPASK